MGSLGSVAAPGFLLLGFATGATVVPYLVFGSLVIAAGVAIPGLPETLDAPTPETVQVCWTSCHFHSLASGETFGCLGIRLLPTLII